MEAVHAEQAAENRAAVLGTLSSSRSREGEVEPLHVLECVALCHVFLKDCVYYELKSPTQVKLSGIKVYLRASKAE